MSSISSLSRGTNMIGEYRFLRTRDGITRFAKVTVEAEPGDEWKTSFDDSLGDLAGRYGDVINEGICLAQERQTRLLGQRYHVQILSVVESLVDTSMDAVRCAAAAAAWKSFGHDESEISISFREGQWIVSLGNAQDQLH